MRVALVTLACAVLLSGCMGGSNTTTSSAFQQTCPAWVQGLSTSVFKEAFNSNQTSSQYTDVLGKGLLQDNNRPLDRISLDFHARDSSAGPEQQGIVVQDAKLVLRVTRDDDGATLKLYDPTSGPLGSGNEGKDSLEWDAQKDSGVYKDFTVQLDLAAGKDPPRPTSVTAEWTFVRDVDNNPATSSAATFLYTAHYLYRQC